MEEEAARRFVAEQTRQLSQGGLDSSPTDAGSDLQHKPTVHYAQSSEEQAMLREQVSDAWTNGGEEREGQGLCEDTGLGMERVYCCDTWFWQSLWPASL